MVLSGSLPHRHWQGVQVITYLRTAKCGHSYSSPAIRGRVRATGECGCSSKAAVPAIDLTCVRCGTEFQHSRHREYCGNACRATIKRRRDAGLPLGDYSQECDRCGCDISNLRQGTRRCLECRHRTAPIYPTTICINPRCGVAFTPFKAGQQSCGNACAQKVWKAANPQSEEWNDRRRANYQKRRALKRLLPAENVISRTVFERDGWMCGICSGPVDASLAWPDPYSPSLDHVVPLARGGHHTYQNTQLAHLRCNVSKGDRVDAVAM